MRYRQFGRCGFEVSALGFGCMRLPCVGGDQSAIREDEAVRMIRYAIDEGVNYVDTAYGYHGGNSEKLVGRALASGYRDRVKLATKLPVWLCKSHDDFDRLLGEQLQRLATDHIDCYLLHSLDSKSWSRARDMGVLEFLAKQMDLGRIRYAGFSFHDSYEAFTGIVDAFDWDFCQIMLSYVDVEYQAGLAGLRYASSHGLAVVVMEPLRGGKLAANLPDEVVAALGAGSDGGEGRVSPAEVGSALGVEPAGSQRGPERDEQYGAGCRQHTHSFGCRSRSADRAAVGDACAGARGLHGADSGRVHRVRVLPTMSAGGADPRRVRPLQ